VTISVVADDSFSPPRCEVTVESPVSSVMQSVSVWRNDSSGRVLLRSQPSAGFDSRAVFDYECPFDELVTYDWAASYTGSLSTLFSSAWADTSGWTGSGWNVSGGTVRNTAALTATSLTRLFASGKYRVTIASFTVSAGDGDIKIYGSTGVVIRQTAADTFRLMVTGVVIGTVTSTGALTLDYNTNSITLTGTGGSITTAGDHTASIIEILASNTVPANGMVVGAITVSSYDAPDTIAEESDPTELNPAQAWLIHPATPSLSVPLSKSDGHSSGIETIGEVVNSSNTTIHKILGARFPISTTTGPRTADQTTLGIRTTTAAERLAMRALLATDSPILIQVPPTWETDFGNGFYQIGDATETRLANIGNLPLRTHTLPATRVQSPITDVANTGWSYASIASEYSTYITLENGYDSYADLLADTRA